MSCFSKWNVRCVGLLMLVATSAWAQPAWAQATPAPAPAQKEELWLDSRSGGTPILGKMVLEQGRPYLVTMQGTFSVWGGINVPGAKSGKPEPAPMWPSSKGANKEVGSDPEFIFAWPKGSSLDRTAEPPPRRGVPLQVSLDGGKTWNHPPSTAPFNAKDHKYGYELMGQGKGLQVRLVDAPSHDNYGRLQIIVQPAEELWLDTRSSTPSSSQAVLERGKPYRVTMQGTFSPWGGINVSGARSGKPEPAPMWPSPNGANKEVGVDPEFVFAWPPGSSLERSPEPSPRRGVPLQVSLDGGKTWNHPSSTAPFNAKDHKYTYELIGDGNALQVRYVDNPISDNYGRVRIFLLPTQ